MGSGVFDFRSKEERERDYKAFYKRVFPGGEAQKERVRSALAERLPGEEITFLLMYYITLKDAMVLDDELGFYEAADQAQRKMSVIKVTPQMLEVIREVMEQDGAGELRVGRGVAEAPQRAFWPKRLPACRGRSLCVEALRRPF